MAEADTEHESQDITGTARAGNKGLKFLRTVVVVVAVAYVMAAGFMYLTQRGFVFVPTGELATPEEKGLEGVTVETVAMADGTEVTVWRAAPKLEGAPTVLYLHGNSSNLSARWKRFKEVLDSGFGLYAPSYRGYAGSGGNPSEAALISDALEHYDRAAGTGTPIILHGESLGTGVATAVAAERPGAGLLVLEAPYTALVDMAFEKYPWLPVGLLMKDPMPTRERITRVKAPVLILHGTADHVIPVDHGKRLFGFAPDPKELVILDGVDHSDLWKNGLWQKVLSVWRARSG